ncbi:FAD-dependent oxidoreductase [uncultured Thiodictyon sp.]|uniref:FAD-dependent oxidoreductase n=1 Tax=uncultured Thiodictyon sp. TaxID=1846217 RepID=UPI0025D8C1F5|nr:FAD-dependent oxidoreductase [uncultured Thiodictyon sp.]
MADKKFAAYLCAGCGLGEVLDLGTMEKVVKREGKMQVIKRHDVLCSADGVQAIRDDIANEGVTHVLIAGCSRRAKTEAFDFPETAMARANLREGVLWVVAPGTDHDEVRQEMADDYIRMGCAELKKMAVPTGNPNCASNKRILVVGGGMSGLTAAIEAAETGYEVLLVEKEPQLGGWAAKLYKRVPFREPYAEPQDTGLAELIARVEAHPKVRVHLASTLAETAGAPGRFAVKIATESGAVTQEMVGAIVQASGFSTYDLAKLPELGGGLPSVVDQAGLEQLAKAANGGVIQRADGQAVSSVVFVQCAGQRDASGTHLPYCSGHCCATSVKQAMYFKDANPDVDTVVLYTDLRMPGMGEDFYRSAQSKGVIFTKGQVSTVKAAGTGCSVNFRDLILNEEVTLGADLVVLATGQVPNSGVNIDLLAEPAAAEQTPTDEASATPVEPAAALPPSILNLTYRQGPDLPQLKAGLTDSHFICFPYETRRTGIYAAGPVRRPMDMLQATDDATGAALKAIQAVENAALGRAAHPRSGDLSYPIVRLEGCTQCKRCTVECPFGAIDEDERRFPVFNESRCRRCGTCMGACPVRVIAFENYSVDTVGSQIKSLDMPDEFSERPRILLLACENDAYPALDMAGVSRICYSAFVRAIPVRCLGSVNTIWITDALNSGWDGVMLMGCKRGDDYQCHFVKGSELAHYRLSKIDDTLTQLSLETERVASFEVAITDSRRVAALINDYAETIKRIGMSPLKGFN